VNAALARLEPLRYARTGTIEVAYFQAGPSNGYAAIVNQQCRWRAAGERDRSRHNGHRHDRPGNQELRR
jgi:hypothetical protein